MEARPHTLTGHLSLAYAREIEFLKKETAQRRVLEESELARKEEMDKLLDKISELEGNLQTLRNSNST